MVYLKPKEVDSLLKLHLSGTEEIVRDRFVVGCLTGLRFSDYSRFDGEHIRDGLIQILTTKRNKAVTIPVHKSVAAILQKWDNHIPKSPTLRYFNMTLPKIAAKAGIRDKLLIETKIENGKVEPVHKLKYELITTHTARRSFATNAYRAGIPAGKIMQITGHKTEQDFFRYIKVSSVDNAMELQGHAFFN